MCMSVCQCVCERVCVWMCVWVCEHVCVLGVSICMGVCVCVPVSMVCERVWLTHQHVWVRGVTTKFSSLAIENLKAELQTQFREKAGNLPVLKTQPARLKPHTWRQRRASGRQAVARDSELEQRRAAPRASP